MARRAWLLGGGTLIVIVAGLWLARVDLARGIIDRQLSTLDLPVRYRIVSIGPGMQVLRDVVVGDPARPDLTIERAEVGVDYTQGWPKPGKITLLKPRLYGTYLNGRLSFGALDRVLFAPTADKQAPLLPDYNVTLIDGRAALASDFGRLGIKLDGAGPLRGGFAGSLAVVAPALTLGPCAAGRTTAFGRLSVDQQQPRFQGPLRMAALRCAGGIAAAPAALTLDATLDKRLRDVRASGDLLGGAISAQQARLASLALRFGVSLTDGALNARLSGKAGKVETASAAAEQVAFDGLVRARAGSPGLDVRGTLDARSLRRGPAVDQALASAQGSAAGTLLAPMIGQIRAALAREESGSHLTADVVYGQGPGGAWHAGVPRASLRGGSGQGLIDLSRVAVAGDGARLPRFSGNFITGGAGLPQIRGRVEQDAARATLLDLAMPAYRADGNSLAVPTLKIVQSADGAIGFSGLVKATGAIPGGRADNLVLPLLGAVSTGGALALFPRCVTPRFDRLTLGAAVLDARAITLCPAGSGAIVQRGPRGTALAATVPALALTGRLGTAPLSVTSGPVSLRWPGALTASAVTAVVGPPDAQNRFSLAALAARLGGDPGGTAMAGTFSGAAGRLAAVPLDLTQAAGAWRYGGGILTVSGARFDLADRASPARFESLMAQDAALTFQNNRISANALLRTAKGKHQVVRTEIAHDLTSSRGSADLAFDGLAFDDGKGGLQPADLSVLAKGYIANVVGKVTGNGRIDWDATTLTSTGSLTTRQLDLAAAFGPVKGISGTLRFVDLLGMVTAPHQVLKVASVNPGIEVTGGVVDLELRPDQVIRLNGAQWPFLGGSIALEPSDLRMALAEERRLTLTIVGFDAARFLEHMQLGNIAATGTFDGHLPLAFDDKGGRILGGMLVSRPPGGNVSYIGALSYKDLSPMANFAFDALKSMDYKYMTVGMRGNLAGDLVTDLRFTGIRQGQGTKQNFLTRRVARLPLQFNINIRAPFYQLITSIKGTYDPAFVRDPRTLGLVDARGRPVQSAAAPPPAAKPALKPAGLTITFPEAANRIQQPASEHKP